MRKHSEKNIIVYQAKNGAIELQSDAAKETIWANQTQIVDLFKVNQSVVSRHIKNIFKDGELNIKSNMQKMHIANSDKPVFFYSLDIILAVGYRTNSKIAIEFRKWANKTLKSHIIDGYTINPARIDKNYVNFLRAVDDVKKLLPKNSKTETEDILELIKAFANTWFSLDAYDKQNLPKSGSSKKKTTLTANSLKEAINKLKNELINKKEATDLFAKEKQNGNLEGIVGNILQSFGGKNVYPTIEEKAAHLLYFIIKNHPFTDGNKRSGAFAFIWFLKQHQQLSQLVTPDALTVLTLLIAESNPKDKNRMIGLILLLLKKD